jgi:hypothetical protein
MEKVNRLFEHRRNINEAIHANEAYSDFNAMMTVLTGKRSVCFLLGPEVEKWHDKYIKNNDKVDLLTVKRDGHGIYGDGYILYSDINKAKHLLDVMMKHDGYLQDNTPEEAIENGEALEYVDSDVKEFTDSHYGVGSYDKAKNKL